MEPFAGLSVSDPNVTAGYHSGNTIGPPIDVIPGPRPYKSRKNRPCDFCRARKAACKISVAPPCVLCHSYGRECTFLGNPQKRKRPAPASPEDGVQESQRRRTDDANTEDGGHQGTSPQSVISSNPRSPNGDVQTYDHTHQPNAFESAATNGHENGRGSRTAEIQIVSGSAVSSARSRRANGNIPLSLDGPFMTKTSNGFSFAANPTKSAVWVGDTGEADPYLCRRYSYGEDNECVLSKITYRRVLPDSKATYHDRFDNGYEEPPVIFMLPDDSLADKGEPRNESSTIEDAKREVTSMVPEEVGVRMVKLFFRFVYPYFPVLSRTHMLSAEDIPSVLRSLPLSLLAAIYATSLPFLLYDDILATTIIHSPPSASRLYRITWLAITQEIHTPRLATFQACLLLLQRAPTNRYVMDTPFQWSLTAWTVSLAYNLGLCKSCSGWSGLPKWERRLRGRLWWATFIMDKWSFLGAGMPSHIKDDDFDVLLPTLSSNIPYTASSTRSSPHSSFGDNDPHELLSVPSHFYHLVHLTTIVSDVIDAYYTIRATSRTANNFSLSLELAKPLRTRLRNWKESFAASMPASVISNSPHSPTTTRPNINGALERESLDGNSSLGLAYIIAAMTLYRALLRAVENQGPTIDGVDTAMHAAGRAAVLAGAKECGKEAVEFVEDLSRGDVGVWDAFWHSWSRANFALASSFLMRVLMNVSPTTNPLSSSTTAAAADETSDVKNLIFRWRRVLRLGSGNAGNGMMGLALLRLEGALLQQQVGDG